MEWLHHRWHRRLDGGAFIGGGSATPTGRSEEHAAVASAAGHVPEIEILRKKILVFPCEDIDRALMLCALSLIDETLRE